MGSEPRQIGDYLLGRRIAVGGMAEIFEARRVDAPADAEPRVVKLLLPQYARDPEVVHMLAHEAELQRRLDHPGLVRVLEHGESDGQAYIVMAHVDGVPLSELMSSGAPMSSALAVHVVRAIADVLAYVHEAKGDDGAPLSIVHRDVTPQNVLISREGDVRLGDFGIARSSLRDARTRTGVIKGKLRYVAPEQVTGSAIDGRTDLYALGVVAFELLTGKPYLTGHSEIDLLREAESPTPKAVADHVDGVDPTLNQLISRMLRRFPEERPSTARAFLRELGPVFESADDGSLRRELAGIVGEIAPPPVSARPTATVTAAPASLPWRPLVALVVGAAAVVVIGIALVDDESASDPELAREVVDATVEAVDDTDEARGDDARPSEEEVVPAAPSSEADTGRTPVGQSPTMATGPRQPTRERPSEITTEATVDEARRAGLASRLVAIRADLRRRGVRNADLSPSLVAQLGAADRALEEGRLDDAESELDAARPAAEATVVDAAFVRRKAQRVDAAIRRAESAGTDTARVQSLSTSALSDLMAGRHEAANRRLNEILDALD